MNDIRWKQRFENFEKAVRLLEEALGQIDDLSILEKGGTIQRFEFTVELAWKTMKDFLGSGGIEVIPLTPKQIIKEAFAAKIIPDGQLWIDMLETRNRLSHTYDETVLDAALSEMNDRFFAGNNWIVHIFQKRTMNSFGLTEFEQELICEVLRRHAEVAGAKSFGSRAKGTSEPSSDIDLSLTGSIPFRSLASIAGELDELPLPYKFDVEAYNSIRHQPLREHIDRVGKMFYSRPK